MLASLTPQQRDLAVYMSELSEQAFSAGWMEGLEQALWRAVISGPFRYGYLTLTIANVEKLRALSNACDGWIVFDDNLEECFVPMGQWVEQYPSK